MGSLLAAVTLAVAFFASAAQAFTRSRFFVYTPRSPKKKRIFDEGLTMATARMLRFRKGFAVFWFDVVGVVSYAVVAVDSAMLRHDEGRPGSCPSR